MLRTPTEADAATGVHTSLSAQLSSCAVYHVTSLLPTMNAMQLMAVGGNHKARQFFKQHGWDEVGSDKIEGKVCCQAAFTSTTHP
jgi:ADP-ribosylation factor GTPase-activating protein 2/3